VTPTSTRAATPAGVAQPAAILGTTSALLLIVGVVVGAGIFKAPSLVAGMTGSPAWMFGAWILGGAISIDDPRAPPPPLEGAGRGGPLSGGALR